MWKTLRLSNSEKYKTSKDRFIQNTLSLSPNDTKWDARVGTKQQRLSLSKWNEKLYISTYENSKINNSLTLI
jgi:hypothetical protein